MLSPTSNLNLLRSLDVLLDTCNLTSAAAILGLTQPALSRQLVQLRTQFGDPLLVREGQRFLLTERAQAMRGPLKAALATLDAVTTGPGFDPATTTRTFHIAGSDYLADHMLPALVSAIKLAAPAARLDFHLWEPGYYRLLSDEGVDLVATIADVVPDNLHGKQMGEDQPVCAMRPSHPLAQRALSLQAYAAWPHARITSGSDRDGEIDRWLARRGLRREIHLAVPFFSSALRIVSENDLLLTIPEHMAIKLSVHTPLVWKPLPFAVPSYRYWMLWHSRSHHDLAHQWFRQQVLDVLHQFDHGVTRFNDHERRA